MRKIKLNTPQGGYSIIVFDASINDVPHDTSESIEVPCNIFLKDIRDAVGVGESRGNDTGNPCVHVEFLEASTSLLQVRYLKNPSIFEILQAPCFSRAAIRHPAEAPSP